MAYLHRFDNQVCPHCSSTTAQFVLYARAMMKREKRPGGDTQWVPAPQLRVFVSCQICKQPSMLEVTPRQMVNGHQLAGAADAHERFLNRLAHVDIILQGSTSQRRPAYAVATDSYGESVLGLYKIDAWYPAAALRRPDAGDIPAEVHEALTELECVMSQPRFAVIACRRILEISSGILLENPKGSLGERIRQLHGEGKLTKEAMQWATALKDLLNGKTHEGPAPSIETAKEVQNLTLFFVDILFVQPARIARMQKHTAAADAG